MMSCHFQKRNCLPRKHFNRQISLWFMQKYFFKIYDCITKGFGHFSNCPVSKKIVHREILRRKQLLWFTDGVHIGEQKKGPTFSTTAIFLRVKWKQKRFISLSEKCEMFHRLGTLFSLFFQKLLKVKKSFVVEIMLLTPLFPAECFSSKCRDCWSKFNISVLVWLEKACCLDFGTQVHWRNDSF